MDLSSKNLRFECDDLTGERLSEEQVERWIATFPMLHQFALQFSGLM